MVIANPSGVAFIFAPDPQLLGNWSAHHFLPGQRATNSRRASEREVAAGVCAQESAQTNILLLQEDCFDGRALTSVEIDEAARQQPNATVRAKAKPFVAGLWNEFARRLEVGSDKVER